MRQLLIALGAILMLAGLAWPWLGRVGLGHLPGDITVRRPGFVFFFPLGSSIVISVVLSLVLIVIAWLFHR
ncbi:MAG: DUF2905 domain-containing protein [Acetobacteraceae bacterium]